MDFAIQGSRPIWQQLTEQLVAKVNEIYSSKKENMPEDVFAKAENFVMLRVIDTRWMAHLSEMDYLKAGIGLRAVGQRDPLVEYKEDRYRKGTGRCDRPSSRCRRGCGVGSRS